MDFNPGLTVLAGDDLVSSPDQIFCMRPADLSKNRLQGAREKFGVMSGDETSGDLQCAYHISCQ